MGRPAITTRAPEDLPEHELLARIFRTLGDPTRLKILEALADGGEASQTELMALVGATQSRASEHLSCLTWCGFVEQRRDGRRTRYRLSDERSDAFLGLARAFLRENERAVGMCRIREELDDDQAVAELAQAAGAPQLAEAAGVAAP
jgi:DNA-binding transcriptional ArsR family regulator